jgi:HEAT repeat protein
MNLLEMASKQATIMRSYSALGSPDDACRYRAMTDLRECGDAGLWCLRLAIRQTGQPRAQFAAAVVLHWLGDRQGVMTLTEALKWRLPSEPLIAHHLESAFVTIGSPDATSALLTVWNMLPDWGDHEPVRASICRVWAALRNPVVLPALASGALLSPRRFEQTVPAFGEMAIPILRDMARSEDSRRRMVAVLTLRHIPGPSAFGILAAALEDPDQMVRDQVPAALERTGTRDAAVAAISAAVRKGHPSVGALAILLQARPADLAESLTILFESWRPEPRHRPSSAIVLSALPVLLEPRSDCRRSLAAICRLLAAPIEPQVAVALIDGVELLSLKSGQRDPSVTEALFDKLCAPNASVRQRAALALASLGDTFPARVVAFLDECKPQDSFISRLQVVLRGGRDAGQAATQAVQQVSRWWARLTSETVDGARNGSVIDGHELSNDDPRLSSILCRMLAGALHQKPQALALEDVDERAVFLIVLLRALGRLGAGAAAPAWPDIVAALHAPTDRFTAAGQPGDAKARDAVASAAAETLMSLYGADSYGLFLEALYSPRVEVIRTGITALGLLADCRALQHLRWIAAAERHPCSVLAAQAVAQIRRTNPEMMSLLRGSTGQASDPDMLLRAARGNPGPAASDLLLRPTADAAD